VTQENREARELDDLAKGVGVAKFVIRGCGERIVQNHFTVRT